MMGMICPTSLGLLILICARFATAEGDEVDDQFIRPLRSPDQHFLRSLRGLSEFQRILRSDPGATYSVSGDYEDYGGIESQLGLEDSPEVLMKRGGNNDHFLRSLRGGEGSHFLRSLRGGDSAHFLRSLRGGEGSHFLRSLRGGEGSHFLRSLRGGDSAHFLRSLRGGEGSHFLRSLRGGESAHFLRSLRGGEGPPFQRSLKADQHFLRALRDGGSLRSSPEEPIQAVDDSAAKRSKVHFLRSL